MAAPAKTNRHSSAMERTGKWIFSQEIPSDVVVRVGEANFSLHKFILVAKSGLIRNLIMDTSKADLSRIELPDVPGGPEIFEKAAKFCYGENFEITVRNVAALRCAAEHLDMSERFADGNLISRTEEFLMHAALTTFSGAIAVLRSCEDLMPIAETLKIVQRCVEVASLKAYNESNFQTRSPMGWWMDELAVLGADFYKRFMTSLKARGAKPQTLATVAMTYAERNLRDLVVGVVAAARGDDPDRRRRQREALDSVVATMPPEKTAFPATFLCCLLRAASFLENPAATRGELEKRVAAVLEHVGLDDLLAVAMGYDGERVVEYETVKRVVSTFAERERRESVDELRGSASPAMQRVAKTVDAYLAEIATDAGLSISKFTGMAILVPKSARPYDDDLYRAVDIYLKAHPGLDEIEREKVCSVLDPLNLSYDARVHASQNKRLPVQIVLHALYYDQLKLRCEDPKMDDAAMVRKQVNADVSLMKENEALREELSRMKAMVSEIHHSKGGSSSAKSSKKPTFFSSMSKTLGKLNPFRHGSKDTSHIENATCGSLDVSAKPRKRRFSIS
ncbi:Root phototropism protein 2 [Nymphaea thermarum]|nr:Root phototropism protein 2 [Nymphaea thermarum]